MLPQTTCFYSLPVLVAAVFVLSSVSIQFHMESSVKGHIFLFFCLVVEKRGLVRSPIQSPLHRLHNHLPSSQYLLSHLGFLLLGFLSLDRFSLLTFLNIYEKLRQLLVVTVTVIRSCRSVESFKYFWVSLTQQEMNSFC